METQEKTASLRVGGYKQQLEFWQSEAKFKCFCGGIGTGKTLASVVECLKQPPKTTGAIICPTYAQLTRGFVQLLYQYFDPFIAGYSKYDKTIKLVDGKKIYLLSAERVKNVRSVNLDWFGVDEGCYVDRETWDTMLGRLRASKRPRAWITSSPVGFNWVYDLFEKNEHKKDDPESDYDPNYFIVHAKTEDNPFLPRENIEVLRKTYASSYATQELDGLFVDLNNARVQRSWFKYGNPCREDLPITLGVDLAISDKNTADFTAIVASAYDSDLGHRYVLDVYRDRLSFNKTQQAIKEMANKWKPTKINIEKVGYQQGAIQELIRTTSLPVRAYTPRGTKVERFVSVEGALEQGHVFFADSIASKAQGDFEDELLSFPNSKFDDMVDALVMSLDIPSHKRPIRLIYG